MRSAAGRETTLGSVMSARSLRGKFAARGVASCRTLVRSPCVTCVSTACHAVWMGDTRSTRSAVTFVECVSPERKPVDSTSGCGLTRFDRNARRWIGPRGLVLASDRAARGRHSRVGEALRTSDRCVPSEANSIVPHRHMAVSELRHHIP
jgi:hypothetical protein